MRDIELNFLNFLKNQDDETTDKVYAYNERQRKAHLLFLQKEAADQREKFVFHELRTEVRNDDGDEGQVSAVHEDRYNQMNTYEVTWQPNADKPTDMITSTIQASHEDVNNLLVKIANEKKTARKIEASEGTHLPYDVGTSMIRFLRVPLGQIQGQVNHGTVIDFNAGTNQPYFVTFDNAGGSEYASIAEVISWVRVRRDDDTSTSMETELETARQKVVWYNSQLKPTQITAIGERKLYDIQMAALKANLDAVEIEGRFMLTAPVMVPAHFEFAAAMDAYATAYNDDLENDLENDLGDAWESAKTASAKCHALDVSRHFNTYPKSEDKYREQQQRELAMWDKNVRVAKAHQAVKQGPTSAMESAQPRLICEFRPPAVQGGADQWQTGNMLYLHAEFIEGTQTIRVDFGPYFDFPDCLPNYPEDTDEHTKPPHVSWVPLEEQDKVNFRYRSYKGPRTHTRYGLNLLSAEDLQKESNEYLTNLDADSTRLWDRNQFFLWLNHKKTAERVYINPVRRAMLSRVDKENPAADLRVPDIGHEKRTNPVVTAEFIAWLHHPILRRMHSQRESIAGINLMNSWQIENKSFTALADAVRACTEKAIYSFYHVFQKEIRSMLKQGVDNPVTTLEADEENIDEHMTEVEESIDSRQFPVLNTLAYHWSNTKPALRIWTTLQQGIKFAKIECAAGAAVHTCTVYDHVRAERQWFGKDWFQPVQDVFASILNSELVVGAQIGALQSYVGTRVHFRMSLLMAGGSTTNPVTLGGRPWLCIKEPDVFIPALSSDPPVGEANEKASFAKDRTDDCQRYVNPDIQAFMLAEGQEQIPFEAYTRIMEGEKKNGFVNLKKLIDYVTSSKVDNEPDDIPDETRYNFKEKELSVLLSLMEKLGERLQSEGKHFPPSPVIGGGGDRDHEHVMRRIQGRLKLLNAEKKVWTEGDIRHVSRPHPVWKTTQFEILSVEVPLYNPFCMYQSKDDGVYKFFATQCDFVALVMQQDDTPNRPPRTRPLVVMGEYKAIMERSNPWSRLKNPQTLSQTVSNAALFEQQTGVKVDLAMVIYLTRRKDPQICYASCSSLMGDQIDGNELKQLKRNICTELRLSGKKMPGVAHFDGRHMCVFQDGFRVKKPKIMTHSQNYDFSTPSRYSLNTICRRYMVSRVKETGSIMPIFL